MSLLLGISVIRRIDPALRHAKVGYKKKEVNISMKYYRHNDVMNSTVQNMNKRFKIKKEVQRWTDELIRFLYTGRKIRKRNRRTNNSMRIDKQKGLLPA